MNFYGVSAWPTVAGNGVADVWPIDCIEGDLEANASIESPLTIDITEEGEGQFTAHITAEQDVTGASFYMVATLDEEVPSADGMSHLPHHVKLFLTPTTGDDFSLLAGNTITISHTFEVAPDWDYDLMGVAAWVSQTGGTSVSPCPYGDLANKNWVHQSKWVPAMGTVSIEAKSWTSVKDLYR